MHLDQPLDQMETDAQALLRADRDPALLGEHIEQAREHVRQYADAIIPHRYDGAIPIPAGVQPRSGRPLAYISPHC